MHLDARYTDRLRDRLDSRLVALAPRLREHARKHDPISVVYSYESPRDAEIAGLIASCLAYGQRKVFIPILQRILSEMGTSPFDFVLAGGYRRNFDWFSYRFNRPEDLKCLFYGLQRVLGSYGSLEAAFVIDDPGNREIRDSLGLFVRLFRDLDYSQAGSGPSGTDGFLYLLPDPSKGGACKRLNMFLRWMIRKDEVDLGLWSGVSPSSLVIPLDVHVQRASEHLGLTLKKGSRWNTALDITDSLSKLDPLDPLKYDFLLFSLGAWGDLASLTPHEVT